MDANEIVSGFILELRRGTIILCVLSKLNTPAYGYNLVETLSGSGIPVEANTLYPLLRRLESQGLIQGTWNTDGSKPRKYYCITESGKTILAILQKHWQDIAQSMNKILEGSSNE